MCVCVKEISQTQMAGEYRLNIVQTSKYSYLFIGQVSDFFLSIASFYFFCFSHILSVLTLPLFGYRESLLTITRIRSKNQQFLLTQSDPPVQKFTA